MSSSFSPVFAIAAIVTVNAPRVNSGTPEAEEDEAEEDEAEDDDDIVKFLNRMYRLY
jgi:hypothetical protein